MVSARPYRSLRSPPFPDRRAVRRNLEQDRASVPDLAGFRPNVWDVAINTLWFSSLVCSLVAALPWLAFFLVGLMGLLWILHAIMAAVVSALVVAALLFNLATLTLPAFSTVDCAFRTLTFWTLRRLRR